jgi:hypothetical protein
MLSGEIRHRFSAPMSSDRPDREKSEERSQS